jgi:hypothetical protein
MGYRIDDEMYANENSVLGASALSRRPGASRAMIVAAIRGLTSRLDARARPGMSSSADRGHARAGCGGMPVDDEATTKKSKTKKKPKTKAKSTKTRKQKHIAPHNPHVDESAFASALAQMDLEDRVTRSEQPARERKVARFDADPEHAEILFQCGYSSVDELAREHEVFMAAAGQTSALPSLPRSSRPLSLPTPPDADSVHEQVAKAFGYESAAALHEDRRRVRR